jgi:hypothetical protein
MITDLQVTAKCREAIEGFRSVLHIAGHAADLASDYAAEVQPAAEAGANNSLSGITAVTAKIKSLNNRLGPVGHQPEPDRASHHAGSQRPPGWELAGVGR